LTIIDNDRSGLDHFFAVRNQMAYQPFEVKVIDVNEPIKGWNNKITW